MNDEYAKNSYLYSRAHTNNFGSVFCIWVVLWAVYSWEWTSVNGQKKLLPKLETFAFVVHSHGI